MRRLHLLIPILLLGILAQHWLNLPIKHLLHQQPPSLHQVSFSSLSFFLWLTIDLEIAHPVENGSSNPFLSPQTPCRSPPSSFGAETFPTPSSVVDTDNSSGLNDADSPRRRCDLPTPPARKRNGPRVSCHSPSSCSSSSDKESEKNSKKARDVHTFFCARGDYNSCILCKYVCFFIFNLLLTKPFEGKNTRSIPTIIFLVTARRLALLHSINTFMSVMQMLGWLHVTSWGLT